MAQVPRGVIPVTVHVRFETPEDLEDAIFDLVSSCKDGAVRRGSNEVTKAAERGSAKLIVMAERSDLYHDARVQKEANSLTRNGYKVIVFGLRSTLENFDDKYSYKDVGEMAYAYSQAFLKEGIQPHDIILIYLPGGVEMAEIILACFEEDQQEMMVALSFLELLVKQVAMKILFYLLLLCATH